MRFPVRGAAVAVLALALASCADAGPVAPLSVEQPLFSTAPAAPADLFFSEYIEGSSNNKALEIYNGTGAAVDLAAAGYRVEFYFNGSSSAGLTLALTSTVASGDVYVVAHSSSVPEILAEADQTNGSGWFNGDDAVVLRRGSTVLDVIGQIGADPGSQWGAGLTSTADNTLRRKATVCEGDVNGANEFDPAIRWDGFDQNTFAGLGSHAVATCDEGEGDGGGDGGDGGDDGGDDEGTLITPTGSLLSELRVEQSGDEIDEYFEIAAAAGTSLDGLTYLVIGTGASGGNGVVASAISLDGQTVPARGFFVAAEETLTLGTADLVVAELGFDNTNNRTHFLVRGFSGAVGTDLDANDDGTLDALPWTEAVDCLSIFRPAGGSDYRLYCVNQAGPDGSFVPGHAYRENNVWKVGDFDAGTDDTPGRAPGTGGGVLTFVGRTASGDPPLPVGFQDQIFARSGTEGVDATWESLTPAIASIDQLGVITGLAAGTARFRATSTETGAVGVISLPIAVATASGIQYRGNTEFGEPTDGDASDDVIIRRDQLTSSFNPTRGTPNWVSYNLDRDHFGSFDRCDCFTMDPELAAYPTITTADYTGSGYSRGHMARSADRDAGSLDNAVTYYFSNIVPQHADNNSGPWGDLEMYLGGLAENQNREVYIVTGVAGSLGTMKDEGKVVIPGAVWKVAVVLPRDQGLDDIDSADDVLEVIAVVMPNVAGIDGTPWTAYGTTVDVVEATSGYDVLAALPDPIERLIERGGANAAPTLSIAPVAPALPGETVTLTSTASDPDGDALTYEWRLPDGQVGTTPSFAVTVGNAGSFTVELVVTDEYGLTTSAEATITVRTPTQELERMLAEVRQLVADGTLAKGEANVLETKLEVAIKQLDKGHVGPASNQLDTFLMHVKKLASSGDLSATRAASLTDAAERVLASIAR